MVPACWEPLCRAKLPNARKVVVKEVEMSQVDQTSVGGMWTNVNYEKVSSFMG